MILNSLFKISLVSVAGIAFVGLPTMSSYNASANELNKLLNSRFVLGTQKSDGSQLSWDYSSFSQKDGKIKENTLVPFEKANMKFGNYKIKKGDILCSPNQDGNYLLMKKKDRSNMRGFDEYEIEGNNQAHYRCPSRGFLQKNPSVKSIQLNGFKGRGFYSSNASTDKIFLSSCSFELKKSNTNGKWDVIWDKCKNSQFSGTNLGRVTMSTDHEVNS